MRHDKLIQLCLNHGEVNPNTGKPDSSCGNFYTAESDQCSIHSGYITRKGEWSCCGKDKANMEGCREGKHETSSWPDEKAKLYFYPKALVNPGLKWNEDPKQKDTVSKQICRCDYFKPIKPYDNPQTRLELLKMKREKEKDEPRYCQRWGCETFYKETENTEKVCLCHPGRWDHGSTGTKMVSFISEMAVMDPKSLTRQTILWKPHWTCCRGTWESKGMLITL